MPSRQRSEVSLLEALRVDRGLSVAQVSRDTGVSHKTIKRYEDGVTLRPTGDALDRLCRYYNARTSTVLEDLRRFVRDRDARDERVAA